MTGAVGFQVLAELGEAGTPGGGGSRHLLKIKRAGANVMKATHLRPEGAVWGRNVSNSAREQDPCPVGLIGT